MALIISRRSFYCPNFATAPQALNQELFSEPLPVAEVDHIARSIHKWIITKSNMWADGPAVYEATFTTIQAARGRKGGKGSGKARREAGHALWRNNA